MASGTHRPVSKALYTRLQNGECFAILPPDDSLGKKAVGDGADGAGRDGGERSLRRDGREPLEVRPIKFILLPNEDTRGQRLKADADDSGELGGDDGLVVRGNGIIQALVTMGDSRVLVTLTPPLPRVCYSKGGGFDQGMGSTQGRQSGSSRVTVSRSSRYFQVNVEVSTNVPTRDAHNPLSVVETHRSPAKLEQEQRQEQMVETWALADQVISVLDCTVRTASFMDDVLRVSVSVLSPGMDLTSAVINGLSMTLLACSNLPSSKVELVDVLSAATVWLVLPNSKKPKQGGKGGKGREEPLEALDAEMIDSLLMYFDLSEEEAHGTAPGKGHDNGGVEVVSRCSVAMHKNTGRIAHLEWLGKLGHANCGDTQHIDANLFETTLKLAATYGTQITHSIIHHQLNPSTPIQID